MQAENEFLQEEHQEEIYEKKFFIIDKGQEPLRIDKWMYARMENVTRNKIQQGIDEGFLTVNGHTVKSNYRVKPNDEIVWIMLVNPEISEIAPENIPLDIVYEDDDVLVVNKAAGMVVHPAYGNYSGTLVNALMYHLKDLPLFSSGEARPGLAHRIDKNTSGILVVAKNEIALNRLSRQFYERTTDRRYQALVWGSPNPADGTITGHVGRNIRDRKIMQVFEDGSDGKPAITHYKTLENLGYITLVECKLETGRTHQIRVHFSHIKHPIFNDEEYGGNQILKGTTFTKYQQFVKNCFSMLPRQALHAKSLAFNHPVTNERLSFDTELPEDMKLVIEKWKKYISGRELEE